MITITINTITIITITIITITIILPCQAGLGRPRHPLCLHPFATLAEPQRYHILGPCLHKIVLDVKKLSFYVAQMDVSDCTLAITLLIIVCAKKFIYTTLLLLDE